MGGRVRAVDGRVRGVDGRVRDVGGRVRGVNGRVRGVGIQTDYVRRVETQRGTFRYTHPHDSPYRLSHM